jgi:ubiquinone/menaquinone biosynthesis C-methylase UbiE
MTEANLKKPVEEDFAGKYLSTCFLNSWFLDSYFNSVSALLGRIQGKFSNCLEVGCGEGFSTARIQSFLEPAVTLSASEYLEEQVVKAKLRVPGIEIKQENIYDLERQDSSIDLLFALEVLEHLEDPEKAISELKRVSNRYLIVGVPREPLWCFLNMARLKYLSSFGNTPGHIQNWSRKAFVDLIEKNFGEVLQVETPVPWTIVLARKSI